MTHPNNHHDHPTTHGHPHGEGEHRHADELSRVQHQARPLTLKRSVLVWSAWQRVVVVLPIVVVLWLAVWWASAEVKPW
jgi:hypothetical protein